MAISVIMPALEMAQETGKILSWRKKEGDRVTKGEALLEIETDKAVVEIEATGEGILAGVTAPEGAVVAVGQTIAWLVQPGEAPPKTTARATIGPARRRCRRAADERARPVGGAAGSAAGSGTAVGAAGAAESPRRRDANFTESAAAGWRTSRGLAARARVGRRRRNSHSRHRGGG